MEEAKTIPLNEESKQAQENGRQRAQRRARERLNNEAGETIARLVNQWYEFFMDNNPDSDAVKEKQKEVSAKWRMYCQRRHLKPEALGIVDKSIDQLMEEYKKAKAEQ